MLPTLFHKWYALELREPLPNYATITAMNKYADQVKQVVKDLYGVDINAELTRPEAKFGDYATNVALRLAGQLKRPPRDIANEIKQKLDQSGQFDEVTIAGPGFINLTVSAKELDGDLERAFQAKIPYGENRDGRGRVVVLDFPSTNTAKPFSVGHMRSANQGWAARNLMLATGWKAISDNHLGDYGSPFGIWVVGFRMFSDEEKLAKRGIYELGDIYIKTKQAIKEEQAKGEHKIEEQAQDWLLRIERGDPEAVAYSDKFNQISLDHIHAVMKRLGVSTDYEIGERSLAKLGKEEVARLVKEGVAEQNEDGSVIIRLDDYGIKTPLLVLKSNGAPLYATNDLATLAFREREFKADRAIYVVASEQKFYFAQLFAAAKKIGYDAELIHMWYGLVDQINEDGVREKMSSRKGVVLLEELLDEAEKRARANAKSEGISDEDIHRIALGAIKFTDFSADRRTGMLFNWDRMFNLTGYSGPYVQYAAVRINKILHDNKIGKPDPDYDYRAEKQVILKLLDYPSVVKQAADYLEPHRIATYIYELAKEMNRYYETTPVATKDVPAGVKAARLGLLRRVAYVFEHALKILGIDIPERM